MRASNATNEIDYTEYSVKISLVIAQFLVTKVIKHIVWLNLLITML